MVLPLPSPGMHGLYLPCAVSFPTQPLFVAVVSIAGSGSLPSEPRWLLSGEGLLRRSWVEPPMATSAFLATCPLHSGRFFPPLKLAWAQPTGCHLQALGSSPGWWVCQSSPSGSFLSLSGVVLRRYGFLRMAPPPQGPV